jgi:polyisoprenyl-phosphate glycosyltransferase
VKSISIVCPCFNEEANIEELCTRVRNVMAGLAKYSYEHLFIDNCSKDRTVEILRRIAAQDHHVKLIVNARNFGHVRSPIHALYEATGDCIVGMASDLQDPPELIPEFVREWESGKSIALAVKTGSQEGSVMNWVRRKYYRLVSRLSSVDTFENCTGFGLYDRKVIEIIKSFDDPYPYFRGMLSEIGLPYGLIPFDKPRRKGGITKNNFYTLYDIAMLGITNLSKVPLRLVTFSGFVSAVLCVLAGLIYLAYKLLFWNRFSVGIAPLVIGIFFFSSVQLISVGILGEYIGSIHTHVRKRPLVVERERVNFEYAPEPPERREAATAHNTAQHG